MNRFFIVFFISFANLVLAQISGSVKEKMDSINRANWTKISPNMDSLANPKIDTLKVAFKDTVYLKPETIVPLQSDDLPITPFYLNNYKEPQKWYFYGQNTLLFNQASFANWNSGGNNNIGINGKINYILNYKNKKHYLENILQMGYGWLASEGQTSRKTDDYINLMSNYGYDLGKNYYLSTGFQFLSQFSPGYNYSATPDPTFDDRISRFMAPGYLNVGLGVSYNPNENFQIIVRPVNGKFTIVNDPLLQKAGRYGLERDGQEIRTELGAYVNVSYRVKILKDVTFDNQLQLFSNYVSHPERVDINYSGTLNIKFNKFITTTVSLDMVYDHDQVTDLQRKQTLGVGIAYNLGVTSKDKGDEKKRFKPFKTD